MPIDNLGKTHFTDAQRNGISTAVTQLFASLENMMSDELTGEERSKYGKVGEQGKLLINKVKDYHDSQPGLSSPEVDWEEFNNDYRDRVFASNVILQLKSIEIMLLSIKILRDHDNKTDALRDYQYAKYKSRFSSAHGFINKSEVLKQFFPKTGKKKKRV